MPSGTEPTTIRPRENGDQVLPTTLAERIADADGVLVLSDFDGTLSRITQDPDDATVRTDARDALLALRSSDDTDVAIVSGRGLDDVAQRVDLPAAWYAGNHGLEIRVGDETFVHPNAEGTTDVVAELCGHIRSELADVDGAIVEDKGLTATVHYRMVEDEADVERVEDTVTAIADGTNDAVRVTAGRQILELRPDVDWDKGRAVEWMTETAYPSGSRPYRLYLGDDVSDEAAFGALASEETAVLVAEEPRETDADYRISDPAAVASFLSRLADHRKA